MRAAARRLIRRPRFGQLVLLLLWGCAAASPAAAPATDQARLRLPPGFAIDVFARNLGYARFLAVDPRGTLLVSVPRAGRILALPDDDGDGRADRAVTVIQGLELPHGLAFHEGLLYIAETGRVVRVRYDAATRRAVGTPEVVVPDLPPRGGHWTRTLAFGPDRRLYVSIGSSCNDCEERDRRRASVMRYNADGSEEAHLATGLRNAVGLAFRPGSDELWATVNGRDWLGDDRPAEYITRVEDGGFYGWPYCHWDLDGRLVPDPDLGSPARCARVARPSLLYQAHTAPLGLAFYTGAQFPAEYRGNLFVALHGSWNRTTPTGYKVIRVRFDGGAPRAEDFATGWLEGREAHGRPVDLAVARDGSLFLSDDAQGVVYRITYRGR
jgi:glucose/arabinose dehydrogenase